MIQTIKQCIFVKPNMLKINNLNIFIKLCRSEYGMWLFCIFYVDEMKVVAILAILKYMLCHVRQNVT